MVLTTMSTWLFCSAAMRSADDRMRYSTCDGVPKMSRATSPAMSTSKPVISPVIGSRKLNRLLPMSRPTMSLPRLRMLATAASASALVGNGRRLAGAVVLGGGDGLHGFRGQPPPCPPASAAPASRPARGSAVRPALQPASTASAASTTARERSSAASVLRASAHHRYSLILGHSPERHRDRRDHAQHRGADGRARQHPPRVDDVAAQLLAALLDALGQRGVELVERRRRVVLAGAERDLGGGLVVADGDVGVDPVVGGAPTPQQLFGVGQVGLVDRVRRGRGSRTAAAAWCRCAGSRTACGRPRRRAGSTTASRRRAPAGR